MKVLDKKDIRRFYIRRRERLPEEEVRRLSEGIVKNLLSLKELREAKRVLLYCPHRGEPDISYLFDWVLSQKKELVLPKVEGKKLRLLKVEGKEVLKPGAFCILEPEGGEEVKPEEIDFSIIPGVAFDLKGYRIGYGKGYYDRLLERLGGIKAGVCYSFQLLEEVPRDSWDRPVDLVVCEDKIYRGG
jgi:5-formyltetrahydrofolate cyclo-ligase